MACSGEMIDCEVCQCRHPADFACDPIERAPRFAKVYCSQCGGEFGPRDSGFSHCEDHKFTTSQAEERAARRALAQSGS